MTFPSSGLTAPTGPASRSGRNDAFAFVLALIVVAAGGASAVQAQPTETSGPAGTARELPDHVRAALEKNARSVGPIKISWTTNYRSDLPVSKAVGIGKFMEGEGFFEPIEVEYSNQENKYSCFRKMWRIDGTSRTPVNLFSKFDGQNWYMGLVFKGELQGVHVITPEQRDEGGAREAIYVEYFDRSGFKVYNTLNSVHKPIESLVLNLSAEKGSISRVGTVTLAGALYYRVELTRPDSDRRASFYLDPAMRYALRRYEERTPDGLLTRVTVNSDFREFSDPLIWMPRRSETEWYTWYTMGKTVLDKPLVHEEIKVTDFQKEKMPDETFVMDMKRSGTIVADGRLGGPKKLRDEFVQYVVPANPDVLKDVIDEAVTGGRKKTFLGFRMTIISINLAIILIAICWLYYRRSRSSFPPS